MYFIYKYVQYVWIVHLHLSNSNASYLIVHVAFNNIIFIHTNEYNTIKVQLSKYIYILIKAIGIIVIII